MPKPCDTHTMWEMLLLEEYTTETFSSVNTPIFQREEEAIGAHMWASGGEQGGHGFILIVGHPWA